MGLRTRLWNFCAIYKVWGGDGHTDRHTHTLTSQLTNPNLGHSFTQYFSINRCWFQIWAMGRFAFILNYFLVHLENIYLFFVTSTRRAKYRHLGGWWLDIEVRQSWPQKEQHVFLFLFFLYCYVEFFFFIHRSEVAS